MIHLSLDYKPGFSSYVGMLLWKCGGGCREFDFLPLLGTLNVTVMEAVRLVDDPEYDRPSTYCKLELVSKSTDGKKDKDKSQRTGVFKKSDAPKWKETLPCKVYVPLIKPKSMILINISLLLSIAFGRKVPRSI